MCPQPTFSFYWAFIDVIWIESDIYNSCERLNMFPMNFLVEPDWFCHFFRPSIVDTVIDLVKGLQTEKMQRRQVVHPQVSIWTNIPGDQQKKMVSLRPQVSLKLFSRMILINSGWLQWPGGRSWKRCNPLFCNLFFAFLIFVIIVELVISVFVQMTYTTIFKLNRNPTHGVWGDQRVPGRPNKVLEERGRGFPRLAQTPGLKHSKNGFWKEIPYQFVPALRPSSNYFLAMMMKCL